MTYKNPILPGFYPDPSVCRVGEDYYLVNSSFEYFPGVPIFHSRDLIHWRQIGHCLTRESQLPLEQAPCSDGIYAPTLRHSQGRFYMATTNRIPNQGFRNFFVHAEDPAGPWSDPVLIDQGGIDPSLFFDTDSKVYWTGNGTSWAPVRGIYQSEIDIHTGKRLSEVRLLWTGTGGSYPEAPHLFKRGDYYYLSVAEGGTAECHMVTIARSRHPFGPFEACPHNPVLSHRSLMSPIQGTGHADFFEDHQGNWWCVFLGFRYAEYAFHPLGRETFLAPVDWNEQGWPVVNRGEKIDLTMQVDREIPPHPWPAESNHDDFDAPILGHSWVALRNFKQEERSLHERPGWLRLNCSPASLNELGAPAFIGRRQQHFDCRFSTRIDFEPGNEWEEAGLTVLLDNLHHAEILITRRQNQRKIVFRRRIGSLRVEEEGPPLPEGPLELAVHADRRRYVFGFRYAGNSFREIGSHEVRYVSSEVAGGYTGVILGIYASSNELPSATRAYFDWAKYEPITEAVP